MQPIGADIQLVVSALTIAVLFALTRLDIRGPWRYVALATASIIVLRYAYWRTTDTLPPVSDLMSFVPGLILYLAEMFCIFMFLVSVFVISDPISRRPARKLEDHELPTVDVFVPSYNESSEILALTLSAATQMDYPRDKFKVYLLDDGGTAEKRNHADADIAAAAERRRSDLTRLCADLGATYLSREENVHAKAGNLNSGLARSSGDLVAVFDADHAPERCFLRETVGYFADDADLFLVQTPHFFSNPDPVERNLSTYARMPSENEMFYSMIQKGLDRWNAAFFCGSAAVLRREALEQVGGFAGITITEDCETALELHARGWNSVYVDKPMIAGLQPESFSSFVGQRSRWCRGMVQILLLKNPLLKPGLRLEQRISYMSSCFFWLFPLVRIAFLVAPALFILFDLKIFNASAEDFLAYSVTYLVSTEILRNYLYGKVRWPLISELYEYALSIFLFRAIISVFLNPRKPTFNVTDKGVALTERQLSNLSWPFFAVFGALAVVLYVAIHRYQTEPALGDLIIITGLWNLVNLVIAGAALGIVTEQPSDIQGVSLPVAKPADIQIGDRLIPVTVHNVSARKAIVEVKRGTVANLRRGDYGRLVVPNASSASGAIPMSIVKASDLDQRRFVLELQAETEHYPAIASLMLTDLDLPRRLRAERQHRRSFFLELLMLLHWAVTCPFTALVTAISGRPERLSPARGASKAKTAPTPHALRLAHQKQD